MTELDKMLQDLKAEVQRLRKSNAMLEEELQEYRELDEKGLLLRLPVAKEIRDVIKINTHQSISLAVIVTDEMVKDYQECEKLADGDGKDCDKCSWNKSTIETVCMCELEEMYKFSEKKPKRD